MADKGEREPDYRLWLSVTGAGILGIVAGFSRRSWWLAALGAGLLAAVVVAALVASHRDSGD